MTATSHRTIPSGQAIVDTEVDLVVVGSGTGLAAALTARELGLSVLVVEKSEYVGGSTARSGGALWLPASPVIAECGADALDNRVEFGVWGGMTERQRRALLKQHPEVVSWAEFFAAQRKHRAVG